MALFPQASIRPIRAALTRHQELASIVIELEPFNLPEVEVDSSIVLGGVALPSFDLWELAGRSISFPTNPEDGYIDGSIYIEHAHHPVDVHCIEFGAIKGSMCEATFHAKVLLSFEGLHDYSAEEDYEDFELSLATGLSVVGGDDQGGANDA